MILEKIKELICSLKTETISSERKEVLQPLIDYIQKKVDTQQEIRLNFICTHNSRRSHLSQVWAQTAAAYYNISKVYCYSGGTEATALFPMVVQTLTKVGFQIKMLSESKNPIYSIKFDENKHPVIGFSKKYNDSFNPKTAFAAILTCSHADENCPFIIGAEKRIAITYNDPKEFDNSPQQEEKYTERSMQIATELCYVFSKIKKH